MYIISSFLKHSIFKLEFVMMVWKREIEKEREGERERYIYEIIVRDKYLMN